MKRTFLAVMAALLVVVAVLTYLTNPLQHTKTFISLYAQEIEDAMASGNGIPTDLGCQSVNIWPGEHPMTEFVFSGRGIGSQTKYYGCYYSDDDVPLAFQNVPVALTEDGEDAWTWTGEGDNHGSTQKIQEHWYFFEASF